jgi:hypothetical protein
MSFQIRNLMIKLASDETGKRPQVGFTGGLDSECCHPITACCDCQTTSKEEGRGPCGEPSRREQPDRPGDPGDGAEPRGALPGLGLLQQQLRQTLSQPR